MRGFCGDGVGGSDWLMADNICRLYYSGEFSADFFILHFFFSFNIYIYILWRFRGRSRRLVWDPSKLEC